MALEVWLPLNGNLRNRGMKYDMGITNHDATVSDGGVIGDCYTIGNGKYISCTNLPMSGGEWSISVWYNADGEGYEGTQYLVSLHTKDVASDFYAGIQTNYQNRFITRLGNTIYQFGTFTVNEWHHFVVTYKDGRAYGYVDGELMSSLPITAAATSSSTRLEIGRRYKSSTYYCSGKINDLRIYSHCITAEDVKDLYQRKVFEFTPQWVDNERMFDANGLRYPLTVENVETEGNVANFNGSSSCVKFDGFKLSGGTVSVWLSCPKPSSSGIFYQDPTSKMIMVINSSPYIFNCTAKTSGWKTDNITWGSPTNIISVWDETATPTAVYVNGVKPARVGSNNYSVNGEVASIGKRVASQGSTLSAYPFSGSINEVKVFAKQFTQEEALALYNAGPCQNNWDGTPEGYERLEYIQSDGNQYIDTGLKGHMNYTYEIDFQQTVTGTFRTWGVFNQETYNNGQNMSVTYTSGKWVVRWETDPTTARSVTTNVTINTSRHTVRIENGKVYFDGTYKGISGGHDESFVSDYNVFLCNINPGGNAVTNGNKAKFYSYKVYDDSGRLIQHFTPAMRQSDGEKGMLDEVTRMFYPNNGTGSFTGE